MRGKGIEALVLLGVCAALALPFINLAVGLPTSARLGGKGGSESYRAAADSLALKCSNCHSDQGKAPFYARLPFIQGLIETDIRQGTQRLDLAAAFAASPGRPAGEVVLAKVEHALDAGSMPPRGIYRWAHWNGTLTATEELDVRAWIGETRTAHYASSKAPPGGRADVLQPVPDPPADLDPGKVELGRTLYHDGRLSKDGSISCASCHDLAKGGTDGERYSTGVGGARGGINAPTVFNAALHLAQGWDGRAADLRAQADGPPNDPVQMASSWPEIVGKLDQDEELKARFLAVYPEGFSGPAIADAIATFEQTLLTPGGAFDRLLLGDEAALDGASREGLEAFRARGCATCHVGAALGGQSYEELGRYGDYFGDRGDATEADAGRFNVTKREEDRHRFKVPSLRNVELTPPWFHDGTVTTLEEATRKMARYQLGVQLEAAEASKLAAFLRTLTGQYGGRQL